MALVMPKTLIIDTNFFVSFHNTHNSAALKNISDLIRNSEFTILVPRGVLEETNYKTNQKLKLIVESAFRIEEIDYENALYKEIRKKAIDRNCFTSNERVDPEVLYLAYLQSQNGRVGIVTFDMGFKIALEVVPLVKQRKIELISPWIFLFEIYKLSDFSLRQKLRKVILDIYYYFYEFRLKEGRQTKDMITEILDNAISSLDILALLNFEIPQKEFIAIEKYLDSKSLSDKEKSLIGGIKDILDGVKLARTSSDIRDIELGLDIAFSQLEKRRFESTNEELLKLVNLLHQLTSQIRISLIQKYVSLGEYMKAMAHIEIFRLLNLFGKETRDLEITIKKMHTLHGFLHILQGNYKQALNALEIIKKSKDHDQDEVMTLLIAYIALDKKEEADCLLEELNKKYPQVTEDLLDLAHNLILTHRYDLAAKILLTSKECTHISEELFKEKISILLRVGGISDLDKELKEKLVQCLDTQDLKDHTKKPLDKSLYCADCNISEVHTFFKDRLVIVGVWPNPDGTLFVKVWNDKLKSMLGVIVPPVLEDLVRGALSIKIVEGKIKKIRGRTPRENSIYNVRGIIELSDETVIETEKWRAISSN
ncbi:MAG: hypothetical protein J7L47_04460 [Candidatus Odinarchaeota archaeon]|nr:hypothetical protein [Candidatus Odinarchaeota archaeon]